MKRCQLCGKQIRVKPERGIHPACIKKMFGVKYFPAIAIEPGDLPPPGEEQPRRAKVDVYLNRKTKKLELADGKGDFVLKTRSNETPNIPEIEYTCLTIAANMDTPVPFRALIDLPGGSTALLVKHIGRGYGAADNVLNILTASEMMDKNEKYGGDLLDIGKMIGRVSEFPGLDVQLFFEIVLLAFITGDNDLNLERFSVIVSREPGEQDTGEAGIEITRLAPLTGLLSRKLFFPDQDDFMMPLMGKYNFIRGRDFQKFARLLEIHDKAYDKIVLRFFKQKRIIGRLIKNSKLPMDRKIGLSDIINERFKRLIS